MESTEPDEAIESIEPWLAIESIEPVDRHERCDVRTLMRER
jgi:hypothetical protein